MNRRVRLTARLGPTRSNAHNERLKKLVVDASNVGKASLFHETNEVSDGNRVVGGTKNDSMAVATTNVMNNVEAHVVQEAAPRPYLEKDISRSPVYTDPV